jgi:DNA-binding MarR family transcriptional regulator
VLRREDRENGRVKHLVLTEEGAAKLHERAHSPVEFNEDAMKDVSAEDLETFKRVLAKMVESVKE